MAANNVGGIHVSVISVIRFMYYFRNENNEFVVS